MSCGPTCKGAACLLCEMFANRTPPGGKRPATWPLHSDAMAVHPSQIPEAMAAAKKHGVPTDFDSAGRAILTGQRHRKEYAEKVRGVFDMDGGYGDPQPTGVSAFDELKG